MYGIDFHLNEVLRGVRKKGKLLYTVKQVQGVAVITERGVIKEVTRASSAATLVRELSRRFGPREYTWEEAENIVNSMS